MRTNTQHLLSAHRTLFQITLGCFVTLFFALNWLPSVVSAQTSTGLTVTPITWDIIGLDSNRPADGPRLFPVGARVCTDTDISNITVSFQWLSSNPYINLRPGSNSSITIPFLAAGDCSDAYFEVEVTGVAAAYDTTREYVITASDGTTTASTPTPRQLYVEHLISQNRNATTNVRFGTSTSNLVSIAPGGTMNLLVGNTYVIELTGSTATQGYEQLESFLTLTNTVFRIHEVSSTYTANTSPHVPNPNDKLYADACLWESDPNSPNYRSCLDSAKKSGGTVVTTYTVEIISGGGTTQSLNSLIYDFSGASFHYNSDFGVSARFASIIDPTSADMSKQFAPATTNEGGVSTLIFTLTNPNAAALSGYNFVDNLPGGVQVADPPAATTSGCGTPVFSPSAGATSISFTDGTVAGNGTCTITVNVSAASVGVYTNTSENLFIDNIDTGNFASADLTVTTAPPPPTCTPGLQLARWEFPIGGSATNPAPTSNIVSATAAAGPGLLPRVFINTTTTATAGSGSWEADNITTGATLNTAQNEYYEFAIDTSGLASITLDFAAQRTPQGPQNIQLYYGATPPGTASSTYSLGSSGNWIAFGPTTLNTGLNPNGVTYFRLYVYNAGVSSNGHSIFLDNVTFTGCGVPQQPTLTKAFAPSVIAANGVSTLTFTLSNPNSIALTNASFTDTLPTGMTVANPPNASSPCGGIWSPAIGTNILNFSGGTIPANSSCTVQVDVTTSVTGPNTNISGFISTSETGQNSSSTGSASATLTVIAPPQISKQFAPNPILTGGVSQLSFTIINPNQNDAINGVAFTDTFPSGMIVASAPNAAFTGCGAPSFSPTAGSNSISFTGGTIAGGETCTVSVDVTVGASGDYTNTSSNVSHIVNSQTVNGNTASDTLTVVPPNPGITMLKQVGMNNTASGPWLSYLAVSEGESLFYLLTIENTGDVALNGITVSDPNVNTSSCTWPDPLPVASASNDNHIATCIVGPVTAQAGANTNTATASGTNSGVQVTDQAIASSATGGLTIVKEANPTSFTSAGETINFTFTVTNTGSAILSGPVVINDDLTTNETCPALSSIGNNDNFFNPGEVIVCTASYVTTSADVTANGITNVASASAGSTTSATTSVTVAGPGGPVPTAVSTAVATPMPTVIATPNATTIAAASTPQALLSPEELEALRLPDTGETPSWHPVLVWIGGGVVTFLGFVTSWLFIRRKRAHSHERKQ